MRRSAGDFISSHAVTIPPHRRDKALVAKLRNEWPGILQWMIEGCLKWQTVGGLNPPRAVQEATDAYLETEDSLSAWIEDRCQGGAKFWESAGRLFASWKGWAELSGEHVGSQKALSQKLQKHGFAPKKDGRAKTRGFEGIRLVQAEAAK